LDLLLTLKAITLSLLGHKLRQTHEDLFLNALDISVVDEAVGLFGLFQLI